MPLSMAAPRSDMITTCPSPATTPACGLKLTAPLSASTWTLNRFGRLSIALSKNHDVVSLDSAGTTAAARSTVVRKAKRPMRTAIVPVSTVTFGGRPGLGAATAA